MCCLYCGADLTNKYSKYCNNQCFSDFKYLIYINKWKLGLVDGSKSNGNAISNHVRKYLWKKYDGKCSSCGWDTPNPYTGRVVLEIEHIDGDCHNNKEDNLDLICPNCHSLTSTYKALNSGKASQARLKYFKLK